MKNSTADDNSFSPNAALIKRLKSLLDLTRQTGSKALSRESVKSYWEIGGEIAKVRAETRSRLTSLAKAAESSYMLFKRCRQFYANWPQGLNRNAEQLTWSEHIYLLPVTDPKVRDFYIKEKLKNGWNRESLARAIKNGAYDRAQNGESGMAAPTKLKTSLHVYKATVLRIVDGDTLDLLIDAGFDMFTRRRIRLKGLNCAELETKTAKSSPAARALAFVQDKLKACEFVVVKTYKTDIYGRFLADVYYHPDLTNKDDVAAKGFHLNQQLLDTGLARPMLV